VKKTLYGIHTRLFTTEDAPTLLRYPTRKVDFFQVAKEKQTEIIALNMPVIISKTNEEITLESVGNAMPTIDAMGAWQLLSNVLMALCLNPKVKCANLEITPLN
jgi:hypothetical protein